jgi:hypothetical protein
VVRRAAELDAPSSIRKALRVCQEGLKKNTIDASIIAVSELKPLDAQLLKLPGHASVKAVAAARKKPMSSRDKQDGHIPADLSNFSPIEKDRPT